ncbi:glycosyltransferase [Candidatus Woesearchaeota archaeon]|nr:glycosyltransferase [Candidatus Woesearchaeota archaeon]
MLTRKVSVILAVQDSVRSLGRCLSIILDQSLPAHEVIVVANRPASRTAETRGEFSKPDPKVRFLYEPFRSRAAARNKGAMSARGDILLMTDPDCLVPHDWIECMTAPLRTGKAEAAQGSVVNPSQKYLARMQEASDKNYLRRRRHGRNIDHVDAKNFAILAETLFGVGMFNRDLGDCEDYELSIRLKKAGIPIIFLERTRVTHHHHEGWWGLLKSCADRGYWSTMAYWLHRRHFLKHTDETVRAMDPFHFIAFFPRSVSLLLTSGPSAWVFGLAAGTAWRVGILKALIQRGRYLSKISHPYY